MDLLGFTFVCSRSWTSLVVQTVNVPAMQETRVQSLGQEDALGKGMATHFSILPGREAWQATVHRVAKSWTWLSN